MTDYTHLPIDERIDSLAGYYVPLKEVRMPYKGREVLYMVGQAVIEASCCGMENRAYALVPGYIVRWQYRKNDKTLPVTQVEHITDEGTQTEIRKLVKAAESVPQVDFWQ